MGIDLVHAKASTRTQQYASTTNFGFNINDRVCDFLTKIQPETVF
jgi:hypothetical protein